jgi:hypothetical protein
LRREENTKLACSSSRRDNWTSVCVAACTKEGGRTVLSVSASGAAIGRRASDAKAALVGFRFHSGSTLLVSYPSVGCGQLYTEIRVLWSRKRNRWIGRGLPRNKREARTYVQYSRMGSKIFPGAVREESLGFGLWRGPPAGFCHSLAIPRPQNGHQARRCTVDATAGRQCTAS